MRAAPAAIPPRPAIRVLAIRVSVTRGRRSLLRWSWAAVLLLGGLVPAAVQGQVPSCASESEKALPGSIRELLDLRSIAVRKPWRTAQQSSYDPAGGFYDSGHFVRIEDGRQLVLLDTAGPGCVDRMWFTRKRPGDEPYQLQIFVDGHQAPVVQADLDALFDGSQPPFAAPLVGRCGLERTPGLYAYAPIGFQQRCKIVLIPTAPDEQYQWRTDASGERVRHVYYQITYRRFQPASPVAVFAPPGTLDEAEVAAFAQVSALWKRAGECPWELADRSSHSTTAEVPAGSSADLLQLAGPGVIYGIRLVAEAQGQMLSDADSERLDLEMTWDDASRPQIAAPWIALFACPTPRIAVRGLWAGCLDGTYYLYLPMPFARSARLAVRNRTGRPVTVTARFTYRHEELREGDGRLATYRYDVTSPAAGQDYLVFQRQGAGHVMGLVMDRPGHMEGDDRWFFDGQPEPAIHGTGTEDFFNFAWGLTANQTHPQHGMVQGSGSPLGYRFLFPAAAPFERSLRITWEHGHSPADGPNQHAGRYSGLVLYYAVPDETQDAPAQITPLRESRPHSHPPD